MHAPSSSGSGGDERPAATGSAAVRDDPDEIREAEAALVAALERLQYSKAAIFAVRLAFEEAVTNAIRHGHRDLPEEPVKVDWAVEPDQVTMTVEDKGPGFNLESLPDPTSEENLAKPSGRGIMLINAYMTEVAFNDRGNRLMMRYERPDLD